MSTSTEAGAEAKTEEATSLGHEPGDSWEFDESVAEVFDDMLQRSIPQYGAMRDATLSLGRRYVRPRTDIVDLGASRGGAIAPFVAEFGAQNRFVMVEVSSPMLGALHRRFGGYEPSGTVEIRDDDLRHEFPPAKASLILSVLTVQFVPIEYRLNLLTEAYNALVPGGALIFVEKILGSSADLDNLFVDRYYDLKRANGYTDEEIDRKRLALEGKLVPVTAKMNEEFLASAGFRDHDVDVFWRWLNFAGWIAVKR